MDPVKILRRAWQILWSYRTLWVFGLILALAGAGSSANNGSNNGSGVQYQIDSQTPPQQLPADMREAFHQAGQEMQRVFHEGLSEAGIPQDELTTIIWIVVIFVLFMLLIGVAIATARYVAETAVIRMVDEYENTSSKISIREGFRLGWSRTSWRLFLINLLVNLPLILAGALLLVIGFALFMTVTQSNEQVAAVTLVSSIGMVFLVIFAVVITSILLRLLRHFFWRVCALENADVGESLRRGFQMARDNWKNVGLMWLVMIGLTIAWAIVSILAMIVTLPLVVVTGVIGALVAAIPALLAGGVTSLFAGGWVPWIAGGLFALPLFLVVAFFPWLLLGSWQTVFTSTVWTLVYRELKALPALTNGGAPAEAATD
jgi:hypothetical protein